MMSRANIVEYGMTILLGSYMITQNSICSKATRRKNKNGCVASPHTPEQSEEARCDNFI